jgi:Domain of unknown function (DUF4326)
MFEDWSVDVDQADDDEPAGRTDRQWPELPSERHQELLALLYANSHRDRAGRLVSWWLQDKLAGKLGVSVRTLRSLVADLREPGNDPRHPTGKPAGLRLGLVKVEVTSRPGERGGRLLAGNLYVLVEHQIPRSYRQATKKPPLTSGDSGDVACLNKGPTPSLETEGEYLGVTGVSSTDVLAVLDVGQQHPFGWLDYDPTPVEALETLERAFGPVTVLQWPEGHKPPPRRVRIGGYPQRPRVPAGAVSVAYPSRWRNPYRPRKRSPEANAKAVQQYRHHLQRHPRLRAAARQELAGLDLACWCSPDLPCHADVLLEIANPSPRRDRA